MKKTALDLACEYIKKRNRTCLYCPVDNLAKHLILKCPAQLNYKKTEEINRDNCSDIIKQSYQKKADIPDGWDVVKKEIKNLRKGNTPLESLGAELIIQYLSGMCKENGIEVE